MTTLSLASTFARRRLTLGISAVGLSVVLAAWWTVLLATRVVALPATWDRFFTPRATPALAAALVLAVFTGHAVLLAGIEYAGGLRVVRVRPTVSAWWRAWLRGVAVQGALIAVAAGTMAAGAMIAGWIGVVTAVVAVGTGLLAFQGAGARLVAALPLARGHDALVTLARALGIPADALRVVDTTTPAFVGGWVGLSSPELWVPRGWLADEQRGVLAVQLARRAAVLASGARRRALWRAVAWPALGIALLAPLLPWSWQHPSLWLALPAVSTLWTFVGVLVLPSFSRPPVFEADARAAAVCGVEAVIAAIRALDRRQDDEPERSLLVELIFHPVPARGARERALLARRTPALGGGHQQARLTLYTSLAGLGLLGRMVHCNVGQPSLWVAYPGD
jgi:hypothetical protein